MTTFNREIFFNYDKQYSPPEKWEDFEKLCHSIFKIIYGVSHIQPFGRRGQKQYGIDIWCLKSKENSERIGIQCKKKEIYPEKELTQDDIDSSITKLLKLKGLKIDGLIICTTAKRDGKTQIYVEKKSEENLSKGFFWIRVNFWDDICDIINQKESNDNNQETFFLGLFEHYDSCNKEIIGLSTKSTSINPIITTDFESTEQINGSSQYDYEINLLKEYVTKFQPKLAIKLISQIKDNILNNSNNFAKYQLFSLEGSVFHQLANYKEAARCFIEAYKYNENNQKAKENFGLAQHFLGNEEKALEIFNKIIEENKENKNFDRCLSFKILIEASKSNITQVISEIPESIQYSHNCSRIIGMLYLIEKKYETSISYLKNAIITSSEPDFIIHSLLAKALSTSIITTNNSISGLQINQTSYKTLLESLEEYDKAIELIYNSPDLLRIHIDLLEERANIKRLLEKTDSLLEDIILIFSIDECNINASALKAIYFIDNNRSQEAYELLRPLISQNSYISIIHPLLEAIYRSKNYNDGIKIIDCFFEKNPESKQNDILHSYKIKYLLALEKINYKEVYDYSYHRYLENKKSITRISDLFLSLHKIGDENTKNKLLNEIEKETYFNLSALDTLILADCFFQNGKYDAALRYYRLIIDETVFSQFLIKLIKTLLYLKKYNQVLQIIQYHRENGIFDKEFIFVELDIREYIADYETSIEILNQFLIKYPDDIDALIRKAFFTFQKGDDDEAGRLLNNIIHFDKIKLDLGLKLNFLLTYYNFHDKSIQLAYYLLCKYPNDPAIYVNYVTQFQKNSSQSGLVTDPIEVNEECVVKIKPQSRSYQTFLITSQTIAPLNVTLILPNNEVISKLIGYKKGNKVKIADHQILGEIFYKIIQITNKYVYVFQNIAKFFFEKFPNNPSLINLDFRLKNNKLPQKTQNILNNVIFKNKQIIDISFNNYSQGLLLISLLAKQIGIPEYILIDNLLCNSQIGVLDRIFPYDYFSCKKIEPHRNFFFDSSSLWILFKINLKKNPKNRIFTSQIQRTAIIESKVHLKNEIDNILNYLRYQKIDANDSEEYQKTYCRLDEITEFYRWIENSYNFIPSILLLNQENIFENSEQNRIIEKLDKVLLHTIIGVKESDGYFVCDDHITSLVAEHVFKLKTISSIEYLWHLYHSEIISLNQLFDFLKEFFSLHLYWYRIDHNLIWNLFVETEYELTTPFIELLTTINLSDCGSMYLPLMMTDFIVNLWDENVPNAEVIVFTVLFRINQDRTSETIATNLINSIYCKKSISRKNKAEIVKLLDLWMNIFETEKNTIK